MRDLTALQTELLECLRSAVEANPHRRIVYCSEWLGYLPYGVYHWVEADSQKISKTFPSDWQRTDLETLAKAELLVKIEEWQNPEDKYDTKVTYEVPLP